MKTLVCVPAHKREEEKKREGRRESFKQKTRRPKQGPGAVPGACSACRPSSSPARQAFWRGSVTEAEGPELVLHAAGEELETKPGSKASQRGSNQRPELASLRLRRDPLRAVTGAGSPGRSQRSWLALASQVLSVALRQLLLDACEFKTRFLIN